MHKKMCNINLVPVCAKMYVPASGPNVSYNGTTTIECRMHANVCELFFLFCFFHLFFLPNHYCPFWAIARIDCHKCAIAWVQAKGVEQCGAQPAAALLHLRVRQEFVWAAAILVGGTSAAQVRALCRQLKGKS